MNIPIQKAFLSLLIAVHGATASFAGQTGYHDFKGLTRAIHSLAGEFRELRVESLGKSHAGLDIWAVSLTDGKTENPALCIIGGAEGSDLASTEITLSMMRHIAEKRMGSDSTALRLKQIRFYFLPRINPDAAESAFGKPVRENVLNTRPLDLDADGVKGEDGCDDLNGDGLITTMRIEDPEGEYMQDTLYPHLMRKALPERGEKGRYKMFSEGLDNDKDGLFNEDPKGGVNINRNFSFNYRFFQAGSGPHPVSEPESRAVADFLFSHPDIAAVLSFGPPDNLNHPPEIKEAPEQALKPGMEEEPQPVTAVLPEDAKIIAAVSGSFAKTCGFRDPPPCEKGEGCLADWIYFHLGRWSFSTRPWWPPLIRDPEPQPPDSSTSPGKPKTDGPDEKGRKEDTLAYEKRLWKWMEKTGRTDQFIPWTPVKHPDFPDQKAKTGGFRPFSATCPPPDSLEGLGLKFAEFAVKLASLLPRISIRTKIEKLQDSVFRLTVYLTNEGFLPTCTALGKKVQWNRKVLTELKPDPAVRIASGQIHEQIECLKGSGGTASRSWILTGPTGSRIALRAGCPVSATAEEIVVLK
ncbi:hypothetical protein JW906_03055 [bacterium]|nr:hypothetical protein [bacterium]